jgi:hypothetical protein
MTLGGTLRIVRSGIALPALTVAVAFGCSAAPQTLGFLAGDDAGAASDVTAAPDQAVTTFGDGGPSPAGLGCSGDLQSVVDANGHVVETCPPDQGCSAGACIAACAAAANNKGTIGCDFVQATPSFAPTITQPCWAVFIANAWGKPVDITVTYGAVKYPVAQFGRIPVAGQAEQQWQTVPASGLPAGQVAVLFMSSDPSSSNGSTPMTCPVPDAIDVATGFTGTGTGQAWHITTDVPVTAYDIIPYGGATSWLPSAELLLPTTAWGTNYVAVVPTRGTYGVEWGQIVASVDDTHVKIAPVLPLPSGTGVAGAPAHAVTTYTLNAGEFLQWQASTDTSDAGDTSDMDMSGSVISSDQPIAFNGGHSYVCYSSLTSTGGGCDAAHQQIPPVRALGSEYAVPPYTTRQADLSPESIPYRLVGMVDATTLAYDPPVAAAPTTLNEGQVADFETTLAFRVKSQDGVHPFYVAQRMTGCFTTKGGRPGVDPSANLDGTPNCLGDEEFVTLMPSAQYLSKYVFFTDPSYATTNLVFVREKGSAGAFADVQLDCAGTLGGWQPVGTGGQYEIADIDLIRAFIPQGTCTNGPHTARSTAPFGLMVWGEDYAASYAYPAGGNVTPINTVVVPPTTQ